MSKPVPRCANRGTNTQRFGVGNPSPQGACQHSPFTGGAQKRIKQKINSICIPHFSWLLFMPSTPPRHPPVVTHQRPNQGGTNVFVVMPNSTERRQLRNRRLLRPSFRQSETYADSCYPETTEVTPDETPAEPTGSSSPSPESAFECNVCFDVPTGPVVTPCGHLYCWLCLYKWMRQRADSPQCPVCKAGVDKRSVIPIYGRGRAEDSDPREHAAPEEDVPPRPSGHRATPAGQTQGMHPGNPFGMQHTPFGRINPYGANYDNVSLSTFGLFPSLFGLQIAYPQVNEPPREELPANPDDGMSELGKSRNHILSIS